MDLALVADTKRSGTLDNVLSSLLETACVNQILISVGKSTSDIKTARQKQEVIAEK
jgi:hypothetical protein